jgi:hypothetical protein
MIKLTEWLIYTPGDVHALVCIFFIVSSCLDSERLIILFSQYSFESFMQIAAIKKTYKSVYNNLYLFIILRCCVLVIVFSTSNIPCNLLSQVFHSTTSLPIHSFSIVSNVGFNLMDIWIKNFSTSIRTLVWNFM